MSHGRSTGWMALIAGRRGAVALIAAGGIAVLLAAELWAMGAQLLAEGRTLAIVAAHLQADYAAQGGLAVAAATIARGDNPNGLTGLCGPARYHILARRAERGWDVTVSAEMTGPLGYRARQTVAAQVRSGGRIVGFRYLRPMAPAPAGRT